MNTPQNASRQTTRQPFQTSLCSQLENLRAWSLLMVLMFLLRFVWIGSLRDKLPTDATWADWSAFFVFGIRIDSVTVTTALFPAFGVACLLSVFPRLDVISKWVRLGTVALIALLAPIISFANVVYYRQFGNLFDEFILEFFEGNAGAVVSLAVTDFGLVPKTIISLGITIAFGLIYRRATRRPVEAGETLDRWARGFSGKAAITAALMIFVVLGYRGTWGPARTQQIHSGISKFRVLNMGTLNGLYNLKTAFKAYQKQLDYLNRDTNVPPEDVRLAAQSIAQRINAQPDVAADPDTLLSMLGTDSPWKRSAAGPRSVAPSHVFVLFLESYDSWAFNEKFDDLQLVEKGKQLGKEGHLLLRHLPAANASIASGLACVQGIYESYRGRQQDLPTSLVHAFRELGYRTRSVNGFSGRWGDARRIAQEQGFDETLCTEDFLPGGETTDNQLHDRTLFKFASDNLSYDEPTFSFIRSSSYHGPFEVDLEAEDCCVDTFPQHIKELPGLHDEQRLRTMYGHLKYTDREADRFIRKMIKRFPNSLFVVTGDHFGRHYLSNHPTIYEASSVPLILFGPKVLEGTELPKNAVGCHIDIAPTLIELCAPKGFEYVSLGQNLLQESQNPCAVGTDFVMFPDAVVDLRHPAQVGSLPKPYQVSLTASQKEDRIQQARQIHDHYHEFGYLISRRFLDGKTAPSLPPSPKRNRSPFRMASDSKTRHN